MNATATQRAASETKALIVKVQTLRRQVPAMVDEATWRAFLGLTTGGVTSTRAMTASQLEAVVKALHKAGAPRQPPRGDRRPRYGASPRMAMIRGLWLELAELGAVRDRTEAAIGSFVKRQTGQDMGRLDAAAAKQVIEALKSWRARVIEPRGGGS